MTGGAQQQQPERSIVFGAYRLDLEAQRLWCGFEPLALRPKSWQVLLHLAQRPGVLVSIGELLDAAWPDTAVTPSVLTNVIGELRRALGDRTQPPQIIETVHRRGYRFIAPLGGALAGAGAESSHDDAEQIFVGRARELQRLQSCWHRALSGKRQVVFVSGEAGIGKTTLLNRFLAELGVQELGACAAAGASNTRAPDTGVFAGRAQCREPLSGREAFAPLLDIVEQLVRGPNRDAFAEQLRRYAPTWLAQLNWLLPPAEMQALRQSMLGSGADRMLREGAALLEAAAELRPLVLLVEDLHWSDTATVDLIAALAQRSHAARLLLVATYRPVDTVVHGHPLATVARALCQQRHASEIALAPFAGMEVHEYLRRRFGDDGLAGQLSTPMEHQSGGNPLFLGALATHLVARGWGDAFDRAGMQRGDVHLAGLGLPQDVRGAIEAQLAQLPPPAVALLEAASVDGEEFSPATVAAGLDCPVEEAEDRCHALALLGHIVRTSHDAPPSDAPQDRRYRFVHTLYWHVLYDRLLPSRRRLLHQRIGVYLECAYGDHSGEIATRLTAHFDATDDVPRRVHYRELAAQTASSRFAHDDAVRHLTIAIAQLQRLPMSGERRGREARLQLALGNALGVGHGFADPRVGAAFARAETLARQADAHRERFRSLLGLGNIHSSAGNVFGVEQIVDQELAMVRSVVPEFTGQAYWRSGELHLAKGELRTARRHFEHSLQAEGEAGIPVLLDYRSAAEAELGSVLSTLGFLDQARQARDRAVQRSEAVGLPFSRCHTLWLASVVSLLQRDYDEAFAVAEQLAALSERFGFASFRAVFALHADWHLARQHRRRSGSVRDLERVLDENRAAAGRWFDTLTFLHVATASLGRGDSASALGWIDKAFADVEQLGQRWLEAELYRLKAECLLAQEPPQVRGRKVTVAPGARAAAATAETYLHRAIEIAQQQHAKLWELRATIALARLLARQRRRHEGQALLSQVLGWFTEGFDAADLVEARAALLELSV